MMWLALAAASVGSGWLLGRGDAAENLAAAREAAPAGLLWLTLGFSAGWYGRDRVRLRRAYSSPLLAYAGKRLLMASGAAAATFVLSPVAWPASWLEPLALGAAAGVAVWVGNLPARL